MLGITVADAPSRQPRGIDLIEIRRVRERMGLPPAPPYPQPPLDVSKLKYGNTPQYHRMVQLAKQREAAKREGR